MAFCSTRDRHRRASAPQAILQGLSRDGGLFVPVSLPFFAPDELAQMAALPYETLAARVMAAFLPGYAADELDAFSRAAYATGRFGAPEVAPLVGLGEGVHVLELFHGPTCAFKDFALQMLPRLLTAAARKSGEARTVAILTATSGDTGKAALEGFADVPGTRIAVFYPHGGTSDMQRLQMVTQAGDNVAVFALDGNFDDAQRGVKALLSGGRWTRALDERGIVLSSANSINWGRLAPQIAYYFWAYARLLCGGLTLGQPVNVCVPTGNFGNILAAFIAKKCGLPVRALVCASNQNNVLTDFLRTGVYDRNRRFYVTLSPSMDILVSSNLERLLFFLSDDVRTASWMESLRATGRYDTGADMRARLRDEGFFAYDVTDGQTLAQIKQTFDETHYLCDTHTAVALHAAAQYRAQTGDTAPMVVASTASPFKFAGSILTALGAPPCPDGFAELRALSCLAGRAAPPALAALEGARVRFDRRLAPAQMEHALTDWLLGVST